MNQRLVVSSHSSIHTCSTRLSFELCTWTAEIICDRMVVADYAGRQAEVTRWTKQRHSCPCNNPFLEDIVRYTSSFVRKWRNRCFPEWSSPLERSQTMRRRDHRRCVYQLWDSTNWSTPSEKHGWAIEDRGPVDRIHCRIRCNHWDGSIASIVHSWDSARSLWRRERLDNDQSNVDICYYWYWMESRREWEQKMRDRSISGTYKRDINDFMHDVKQLTDRIRWPKSFLRDANRSSGWRWTRTIEWTLSEWEEISFLPSIVIMTRLTFVLDWMNSTMDEQAGWDYCCHSHFRMTHWTIPGIGLDTANLSRKIVHDRNLSTILPYFRSTSRVARRTRESIDAGYYYCSLVYWLRSVVEEYCYSIALSK